MLAVTGPIPGAVVRTYDDGRVEVLEAPKLAEFSLDLLRDADPFVAAVDELGFLDLAGQATYRPVAFRSSAGRITLICERVR